MINTIPPSESLVTAELNKVYVGQTKNDFSMVKIDHFVLGVCSMFGSFVKFVVTNSVIELAVSTNINQDMCSASSGSLPTLIKEKTRKDRMYNEILKFFSKHGLKWYDPEKYGRPFVGDLCNVLWYIDGHHDVFASRSCHIPPIFTHFVGFNRPELSKHRKRSVSNLSCDRLDEYCHSLQNHVMSCWIQRQEWMSFRENLVKLIESIASYCSYLVMKNKSMKLHHASPEPSANFTENSCLKYIAPTTHIPFILVKLNTAVHNAEFYCKLFVNEYLPMDSRRRYLYTRELEKGLLLPVFMFTYTHGSNVGNFYFIWKSPPFLHKEASTIENVKIVEEIKKVIPVYHTRAMKRDFCEMYGRVSPMSKPYVLRSIYNFLTNDHSTSRTTAESEVDARMQEALLSEDPDIIIDLRERNSNDQDKFSVFWDKCNEFLLACTSVQERRHGETTYMAKAISVMLKFKICALKAHQFLQSHGYDLTSHQRIPIH